MKWNTKRGYSALALALLIFTTSVALSSYKIQQEYHRLNQKFIPNLWVAAQTELEFYRLRDALHLYIREDSPYQIDQIAKRLHILMSRLPLMLQGSESNHVRAVEGAVTLIENFRDTLDALEPRILSLRKGDGATYLAIQNRLEPFIGPRAQDRRPDHAQGRGGGRRAAGRYPATLLGHSRVFHRDHRQRHGAGGAPVQRVQAGQPATAGRKPGRGGGIRGQSAADRGDRRGAGPDRRTRSGRRDHLQEQVQCRLEPARGGAERERLRAGRSRPSGVRDRPTGALLRGEPA